MMGGGSWSLERRHSCGSAIIVGAYGPVLVLAGIELIFLPVAAVF